MFNLAPSATLGVGFTNKKDQRKGGRISGRNQWSTLWHWKLPKRGWNIIPLQKRTRLTWTAAICILRDRFLAAKKPKLEEGRSMIRNQPDAPILLLQMLQNQFHSRSPYKTLCVCTVYHIIHSNPKYCSAQLITEMIVAVHSLWHWAMSRCLHVLSWSKTGLLRTLHHYIQICHITIFQDFQKQNVHPQFYPSTCLFYPSFISITISIFKIFREHLESTERTLAECTYVHRMPYFLLDFWNLFQAM